MNAMSITNGTTVDHRPAGPRDIDIHILMNTVSSYYGPGMVLSWLLVYLSVIITWIFHKTQASIDTVAYDLMATLAYPAIAAGHMLYLIAAFPGDRAQILTTRDSQLTSHVAEIDAALCVCDSFAILSLALAVIAMWKCQPKRFFAVMPVGMLCFEVEYALFWISPTSSASNTNLSRPYTNMSRAAIVMANVLLATLLIAAFVAWVTRFSASRLGRRVHDNEAPPAFLPHIQLAAAGGDKRFRTFARPPTWLSIIAMPILAALVVTENLGVWGSTRLSEAHRSYIFIPLTNVILKDIDQIVKLCTGACTLLCSCYGVIASAIHNDAANVNDGAAANGGDNIEMELVH